ncbi:hydroxymethylglutaryl-CoA lyase [Limibaculum sp. M0105]|uniref:Hydroxymethylglutaryl-CoA lyase n=1 Tax=Thermohalobaculum xanthum TaxID=2753746 RepID=A0A8J7SCQ6_9RHOB|nr:hydroxymethylglutaryl-CoA lyase [Thermohalobaculum xanthum]MBK0398037.1 hydroxymethylglutaryl-CoA lyase [Thermohalobaculum xanthum]
MTDITIVEVGPRDGLQNEARPISAAAKIELIDRLSACGFKRIEAASFVSPKWVPQMADGAAVMEGISRRPGTVYSALTPNLKGYEAARAAGADEVAIFGAASETFSQRNINASIAESLERFRPVAEAAKADGIPVRGYVSCIVVCPYEGAIAPDAVARVTAALFEMGCHEVSLGDTVGRGTPTSIGAMLEAVLDVAPASRLAGHYHDTNGRALESVAVSVAQGLQVFDSAIGGLGGCPYAPGAKGNLSTTKLANWCAENGHRTGLDMERLKQAENFVADLRRDLDAFPDDPA